MLLSCCHIFCRACIVQHITTKLNDKMPDISCPLCPKEIKPEDMKSLVTSEAFMDWCEMSFLTHLEGNRDVYYHCPTPDCPGIVEKGIFDVVECPSCQKSACIKCYRDHSEFVTCAQYDEWKELNEKSEDIFEGNIAGKVYQMCPGCQRYVVKISGCNQLKCRCNQVFYWMNA